MLGILGIKLALAGSRVGAFVVNVVKWFVQGLVACVEHPVTFLVIFVAFGVGWGWGHHYGTVQLRRLNAAIVAENKALDKRADDAISARRAAEKKLVDAIAAQPEPTLPQEPPREMAPLPAGARPRSTPRRPAVRRVPNVGVTASAGSWLPSFLADPPQRD